MSILLTAWNGAVAVSTLRQDGLVDPSPIQLYKFLLEHFIPASFEPDIKITEEMNISADFVKTIKDSESNVLCSYVIL